ncbi:MAG: OmpP1/FadL family transporter [Prolixibacteraceae bacterium]
MKKYIISALILISVQTAFAQDFFDALRFSQTEYGGTARSIAMGSAFGALGGDFISASINPAGMGLYRSSEFSFSPTLNLNQTSSSYLGNTEPGDRYNFNFNNLSWVTNAKTNATTGVLSFTLGVGYNRLKNFSSDTYIQGFGSNTTLLNYFTDYANNSNGVNSFDYHYEGMAYNAWLIDEDTDPAVIEGIYYNDLTDYSSYDVTDAAGNYLGIGYEATGVKAHQQKSSIQRSGHVDEYIISTAVNINNKVYVGATLGLLDLIYTENTMFSEIDNENKSDYFKDYTLETNRSESGFGINFKTGIIYRPSKSLRFGAAFSTPNFYDISRIEDKGIVANYDQEIGNDANGYDTQYKSSDDIKYNYSLQTPLKANFSAAYTIGDVALLSIDYELVNYSRAKFRDSGDNYDYSDQNSDIYNTLKSTGNIRIGGEYRLTPNFSLRGGYNLFGNPWKSSYTFTDGTSSDILNKNDTYSSYSAGAGYRVNNFYVDFAYRLSTLNYSHQVHEVYYTNPSEVNPIAKINEVNNQATLTFGFRF